ncbi:hypothetical protein ACIRFF_08640 [Streptomyces cyaneofuscatus]
MALPAGTEPVILTDSRTHPDGTPMTGRLTLRPEPLAITSPTAGHIVMGPAEGRWIDGELRRGRHGDGAPGLPLLPADADGFSPTGWTYTVTECPDNAPPRPPYSILITSDLGPTVDLADLAPLQPYAGNHVLVPGPPGLSAYDLAVLDGFVGSQAEWIASLKGPKGDPGNPPSGDQVGGARFIDKPTDRPFTTTSLQADDHLTVPVIAGARYGVEAMLVVSGDPAADLLLTIAAPPGSTGHWAPAGITLGVSDGTGSIRLTRYDPGFAIGVGITAAGLIVAPIGSITAGADGTLSIQGAQAALSATPTLLRAGSWLRVTRTA